MTGDRFDLHELMLSDVDKRQAALLGPFTNKVADHFQHSQVALPERMYHYTTLPVGQSILENREFWLFSIFDPASEETQGAGTIDQREVIAGLEIICDEVTRSFSTGDRKAFRIFGEKFESTLKAHYRQIATVHMLCVAAKPSPHLWEEASKRGDPACVALPRALFEEWCHQQEDRTGDSSSGQYYPSAVCYEADELRQRVRPFCQAAVETLDRAISEANGDSDFVWAIMRELSKQLSLPLLTEAYAFKSPDFALEDEIRLLKVFPYGFEALGQSEYDGRRRIIEKVGRHLPIELITDHTDLVKSEPS